MWMAFLRFTGLVPTSPRATIETVEDRHARYHREHIESMRRATRGLPDQTPELKEARAWAHAARGVAVGTKAFTNESLLFRESPGDRERVGPTVVDYYRALAYTDGHVQVVTSQHDHALVYLQAFRRDLEERAATDVETWVRALAREREETRHARRMGLPEPAPLTVPEAVRAEIERRAKERARIAARHSGGSAGGGIQNKPAETVPPVGPKRP